MDSARTAKSSQSAESGGNTLARKTSNIGNSGWDDEFGDLYRTPVEQPKNFPGASKYEKENKRKVPFPPEEDDSNWIHRDKLAQIESRELEEAGFRVPHSTVSRGTSSRSSSRHRRDKYAESQLESVNGDEPTAALPPQEKRQRTMSPSLMEEEDDGLDYSQPDLQAEQEAMSRQNARPGTSRIPVKKVKTPTLSSSHERESSLNKSRDGSAAWTDGEGSAGSQPNADDGDDQTTPPSTGMGTEPTSPTNRSPPKAKMPNKAKPTSGGARKASVARNVSGAQNRNTSSPTKRPGTSSGRPSTSHARPEGDPPWMSNTFKPDPRLPPDQQILPTHAKRMAQEQWEKEGKTGNVYDRDFRLLNTEEFVKPERKSSLSHRIASKENLVEAAKENEMPSWPLGPGLSAALNNRASAATSNGRPGTSGTDHGGYSIMPNLNSPKLAPPQSPTIAKPMDITRMQDPEAGGENEKAQKKGCCCVVM